MSAALARKHVIEAEGVKIHYGDSMAVKDISLVLKEKTVTALIGPSGCGKSTLLRSFNRMNDFIENFRLEGKIRYRDVDIYSEQIDPVLVRKKIGMVFQKPNPFPSSIYKNITWAPLINGYKVIKTNLWKLPCKELRFGTKSKIACTRAVYHCQAGNSNASVLRAPSL